MFFQFQVVYCEVLWKFVLKGDVYVVYVWWIVVVQIVYDDVEFVVVVQIVDFDVVCVFVCVGV